MPINARFYDGKVAESKDLQVKLSFEKKLIGRTPDNIAVFKWDAADTRVLQEPESGRPAVLTYQHDADARLHLDAEAYERFYDAIHQNKRWQFRVNLSTPALVFWFLCASIFVFLAITKLPSATPFIARNIPQEWEEAIGEYAMNAFIGDMPSCDNQAGVAALHKLVAPMQADSYPKAKLRVVKNSAMNAFAAPGDHIVFFSAVIDKADDPSEIAGVYAHELGHIIKNHPMEGAVRSIGLGVMAQLIFGGGSTGDIGHLGNALVNLHYSREAEREADAIALQLLKEAHIDRNGLAVFFKKATEQSLNIDDSLLSYLSTHPSTKERITAIEASVEKHDYPALLSEREWADLRAICD